MRSLGFLLLLAACTDVIDGEPTAPNQLRDDGKADVSDGPLWAGLTSITLERWTPDACNNGRTGLGDQPIVYDEWARTRAAFRNICFEVWAPGITDWDNPEFWRQLDVQVHYRYGNTGEHKTAYVPSIDRRGNNRRYAFALDFALDPTFAASVPALKAPFRIVSESNGWAYVAIDMEVYFTVNGRTLNAPSNRPFVVRYENYVRMPQLPVQANGYVLHDIVTCDGARFGSGAGFFAADLRDAGAIAALGGDSFIYGVPVARSAGLVSMTYSSQTSVPNETLPAFTESGGLRITPHGSSMRVELDVYDRTLAATRTVSATLANCTRH